MNELLHINLDGVDVYAGDKVFKGKRLVMFKRMVFGFGQEYAEVVDMSGKVYQCSPAELSFR